MKKSHIGIIAIVAIILVAVIGYFLLGNSSSSNTVSNGENPGLDIFPSKQTTSKDVSELVLRLSKLPEGFQIAERVPLLESEIDDFSKNTGWQEGYYIRYLKGTTLFDNSRIELWISRYPAKNISKLWESEPADLKGYERENLPDPGIGDLSSAARLTEEEFENINYMIQFSEKDIFVTMVIGGTNTDYELLKELASNVRDKI